MRTVAASIIVPSAVLIAGLAACVTPPAPASDRIPASDDVVRELRETRPAFAELAGADQATLYLWLHANCAVGIDAQRAQFTRAGTRLEAALVEAFKMGPPDALLEELAATRREDHLAITASASEEPFVSPELRKRVLALSEDVYLNDGLARIVVNYKLAALEGLGLVGSEVALTWLERTADAIDDPDLQPAAQRGKEAIRRRVVR